MISLKTDRYVADDLEKTQALLACYQAKRLALAAAGADRAGTTPAKQVDDEQHADDDDRDLDPHQRLTFLSRVSNAMFTALV